VAPLDRLVSMEIEQGRPDAVRSIVNARVKADPGSAPLEFLSARVSAAVNDRPAEERQLRRVVELDPSNLRAYGALGQFYYQAGRVDEARQQFHEMAARQDSVGAETMLGILDEMQQRFTDAQRAYERALALDPNAAVAANNLACLELRLGENLDVALQLAQTARAQFPNEPEFADTLGWLYVKRGLPAAAVSPLLDSIRVNPRDASFRYHLALAYLGAGSAKLARVQLDAALALGERFDGLDDARRLAGTLPAVTSDSQTPDGR